jgi:hypothetical protein
MVRPAVLKLLIFRAFWRRILVIKTDIMGGISKVIRQSFKKGFVAA